MNLLYKSTRNAEKTVTASEAILKGLADDGGLFVPVTIPKLDVDMGTLKEMSYHAVPIAGAVIVMLTALLCGVGVLVARRKRDQK